MSTIIRELSTKRILRIYDGAPLPLIRWNNKFGGAQADPTKVEHVKIPEAPGDDFELDPVTLEWKLDLTLLRAAKLQDLDIELWEEYKLNHSGYQVAKVALAAAKTKTDLDKISLKS